MYRFRWFAIAGAFALIGVLLAIALAKGTENADTIEAEQQRRERVEQKLSDQEAASTALAEQLRQLGQQPVVEPKDPPSPGEVVVIPGQKGDQGARGPSCIEEIGYPRCRGEEGEDGTSGSVGASCVAELGLEACRGPAGADGKNGTDGKDGAPGADGRGIKDAQCGPDGRWAITYTDGTTSDGGNCLIAPGNSGGKQ